MTKMILTSVAALFVATTTASAQTPEQALCTIVADDAAYIMGVRQRGEEMTGVLDAINWMKYQDTPIEGLEIEMASWAWREPVARSHEGRQVQVRTFARAVYQGCMTALR